MLENINNKKVIIIIIIVILSLGGFLYYFFNNENNEYIELSYEFENTEKQENLNEQINEIEEIKNKIIVHILGEVNNQGVISLDEGSRIIDAINIAGGTTEQADLSKINLAYILEDAQRIYIPNINEKEIKEEYVISGSGNEKIILQGSGNNQNKKENKIININTANIEELKTLSGIGESTAQKIINYRNENGKFKTIEDIKNVSGIGDNKFNKIKNNICVK